MKEVVCVVPKSNIQKLLIVHTTGGGGFGDHVVCISVIYASVSVLFVLSKALHHLQISFDDPALAEMYRK